MAYTGKKPIDHTDVTQSQSMTVTDDLTVDTNTLVVDSTNNRVGVGTASPVGHGGFSSGRIVEVKNSGNADTAADNSTISITSSNRHAGLSLESGASRNGYIQFGDPDDDDVGGITYVHSTNDMQFKTAATERMRILGGGGLTFNGDTAAANALDDYEEGSWTPAYFSTGGDLVVGGYNLQFGRYVKIGKMCQVNLGIQTTSISTVGTGQVKISGLPYTVANISSGYAAGTIGYATGFTTLNPQSCLAAPNSTEVRIYTNSSTDARSSLNANITTSNLTTSGSNNLIWLSVTYTVSG